MNSKRNFKSTLFALFALACLAFVSYTVYTYIQDTKDDPPSAQAANDQESAKQAATALEDGLPVGSDSASQQEQEDQKLARLNEQTTNDAKNTIVADVDQVEDAASLTLAELAVSVSFASYVNQELSLGLTFPQPANLSVGGNCLLTITDSSEVVQSSVIVMHQPQTSVSGCRFNQINLSSLSEPTPDNGWHLLIQIYNKDQTVVLSSLSKDILSLSELTNNLNN